MAKDCHCQLTFCLRALQYLDLKPSNGLYSTSIPLSGWNALPSVFWLDLNLQHTCPVHIHPLTSQQANISDIY